MATQAVKVKNDESQGGMGSDLTGKVTSSLAELREFIHDTRVEMKQVTWPTREDVVSTTWVVVVTVACLGAFLSLVDLCVQRAVQATSKMLGVLRGRATDGNAVVHHPYL